MAVNVRQPPTSVHVYTGRQTCVGSQTLAWLVLIVQLACMCTGLVMLLQVYRGILRRGGEAVAVKVQRPGVRESIALDIYILRWLAGQLHACYFVSCLCGTVDLCCLAVCGVEVNMTCSCCKGVACRCCHSLLNSQAHAAITSGASLHGFLLLEQPGQRFRSHAALSAFFHVARSASCDWRTPESSRALHHFVLRH